MAGHQTLGPNVRPAKPLGSTPNLGPTGTASGITTGPTPISTPTPTPTPTSNVTRPSGPAYGYPDTQYGGYSGQYSKHHQSPGSAQYGVQAGNQTIAQYGKVKAEPVPRGQPLEYGRDNMAQDTGRSYADQSRHFPGAQAAQYYPNGNLDSRNGQYSTNSDNMTGRTEQGLAGAAGGSGSALTEERFRESPPPPPPNTSTHPLYNKQTDSRYTASMQDPPRGGYYPAGGTGTVQQPRQYQYSATNPWQREEREKEQALRREAARQWRDQQIAELSALPHRTSQQDEQLRALQLERDFQKRAEEVANQQDDDEESNDMDNESVQRVQGPVRTATAQERLGNLAEQHHNLSRSNIGNQSVRGTLGTSSHSGALHPGSQNAGSGQIDNSAVSMQSVGQHQFSQAQNSTGQTPVSPTYGSSFGHFASAQKSYPLSMQHNEDREMMQRRIEEAKRKQLEYDEVQKKREEEARQQQQQMQMQQMYHQQSQQAFKNQQSLHPGMLRLDNLVINGPNTPSQNGNNEAPPPPERGSSYAVMSQQSALRSNSSTASSIIALSSQQTASIKRVSFHDSSASANANTSTNTTDNMEAAQRNSSTGGLAVTPASAMDMIREDPNNFISDAENLLASPKTPDGPGTPFTGTTPGVIGAQEVYKDPRQKRLAEKQKQQQQNSQTGPVPEKLSFKEKMKMFAMETGEDGTPRDKVKISRAQREIDNIGSPLTANNNNNNNNNNNHHHYHHHHTNNNRS